MLNVYGIKLSDYMYVCVHVCIYVCMCVYTHIVYMGIRVYIRNGRWYRFEKYSYAQ